SRQRRGNVEHIPELTRNALADVSAMSNGQVPVDDGKRIAVDGVVRVERNSFLFRIQIPCAQKAWTLRDRLWINSGCRAAYSMWDMTDKDFEPVNLHRTSLCVRQSLDPAGQTRPRLHLALEQHLNFVDHVPDSGVHEFPSSSANLCRRRIDSGSPVGVRYRYCLPIAGRDRRNRRYARSHNHGSFEGQLHSPHRS